MDLSSILSAEKSKADINSSMILMRFYLISFIQGFWNLPAKGLPSRQQNSSLSLQLMNFMMCTELFLFLLLKWILFNQKFIKIAFFSVAEWIGSFIMIAQTTTLKSNRKREIKNTEKAKSTVRIPLSNWDSLQMVTEYLWLSHSFLETKMSRNP